MQQFVYSDEVQTALVEHKPIVALESTVIAHGLPQPQNLETAFELEEIVASRGAVPATIAVLAGRFHVGLDRNQIKRLATDDSFRKISRRDLSLAVAQKWDCATTVATTMWIAHRAGIRVFATGGIGGVHRGDGWDVSADLPELAATPMTVVCSGAKIVLDLPATREWLETHGVTLLGYRCDEMPAFYSRQSGLPVDVEVGSVKEAAEVIIARDDLQLPGAVLVTVPVPANDEMPALVMRDILENALTKAKEQNITGKNVTPFLLAEMASQSTGRTLATNIALLKNNARVAAEIAVELS